MEVLVEFDYAAEEPDELTIKKGDIIKDVSQFEEGWYIGNLNGKVGVFPDNFVKTIESSAGSKKQTIPVVETVKEPRAESKKVTETESEENRLGSTAKSQKVTGIGLGNIFSGQPIQLRQTSLKEVIKDTESNTDKTVSSVKGDGSNQSTRTDHVRARFDYQPKQLDELELHVDDIIQILDRNLPDEGWWKGKNLTTKKIGVFPDNFVIPVTEVPNDAVDRTQNTASTNTNTAPEPPKVAAKPSPLLGNSTGHMGLKPTGANNTIAQRDNPKVAVASAPNITSGGRLTTNTVATSATSVTSTVPTPSGGLSVGSVMGGSGGAGRWRTTSEHYDVSKSRTDETHGGANPKGRFLSSLSGTLHILVPVCVCVSSRAFHSRITEQINLLASSNWNSAFRFDHIS
ncbi:SH3 domain-containing kinase-binding protein 1 [Fasciola hepatica]|uniref:SH3 domain-containing kinase-binding protein 1 n=1 Tax=Fasciola hepatica TaxID=6192 RepID=A0A4E0RWI9_FASHE|nr:SH3 domain-containing kinase-binding protein 1 [Fasciola hepatica]